MKKMSQHNVKRDKNVNLGDKKLQTSEEMTQKCKSK